MVSTVAEFAGGIMEHNLIKEFYADDEKRKPNGKLKNHKVSIITNKEKINERKRKDNQETSRVL